MKWTALMAGETERKFLIEPEIYTDLSTSEKETQYKIYVYENGIDKYDYLLPTRDDAIEFAHEKFGVSREAWQRVE